MTQDMTPVTASQIEHLLQVALQPIKDQMGTFETKLETFATKEEMDRGFARVNTGIDEVLTVLVNTDIRLTSAGEDHERRIKRLEKKTGLAQMAA